MAVPTPHCLQMIYQARVVLAFLLAIIVTIFTLEPSSLTNSPLQKQRVGSKTTHDPINTHSKRHARISSIVINSSTTSVDVDVVETHFWNVDDCERTKRAVRGCGWVCSGPNGVRGLKTNASSPWMIGTYKTVVCSECHAARWTGCGCRYVFATFPFTGNTWIRNYWDIATGIGTQSMYSEGGKWSNTTNTYGSLCGTNGGRNHMAAWRKAKRKTVLPLLQKIRTDSQLEPTLDVGGATTDQAVHVNVNVCDLVRTAGPNDQVIIKTHLPRRVSPRRELESFVGKNLVCGIIHTIRPEVDSWCRSHGTGVSWWNNATECLHVVAKMMKGDAEFWRSVESEGGQLAGVPVLTLNFTEMTTGGSTAAANSIQKLFVFTNTTVDPNRQQLATLLHGSGSTTVS